MIIIATMKVARHEILKAKQQEVIKRHNETIEVKSQKGMGTEFVFTLDNAELIENS